MDAARTLERRGCRIDDLEVAAGLCNLAAMARMLAEINQAPGPDFMAQAFTNACANGQIAAVNLLLDHGFDINRQLQGHGTGLHHAIMHGEGGGAPDGRLDVVHFLIENGADQNVLRGPWNANAIDFATYTGRAEIVEYLIEKGADDLDTCLKTAVGQGHLEIAELLLDKGADPVSVRQYAGDRKLKPVLELLDHY